jgi:hypothetical protein
MEVTKEFILNGRTIFIKNKEDESDSSKIFTTGKYFYMNYAGQRRPVIGKAPKIDYYTQIYIQIKFLEGTQVNEQDFFNALLDGCKKHIEKYGRLVISDLWTQLNYTMHLVDATNGIFHDYIKSEEDGIKLRENYLIKAQQSLIEYILVPDPKDIGAIGRPPKLVPLKSLLDF